MKQSAGLLLYRNPQTKVEVLLVHPAGPFWGKKDAWSIPKGEVDEGEDLQQALKREFKEETGFAFPAGELIDLGAAKQSGGKTNFIWAVEQDVDISKFVCESTFSVEWPPKSGQIQEFPECDRAKWFDLATAKQKIFQAQAPFIDRLAEHLQLEKPLVPEQQSLI